MSERPKESVEKEGLSSHELEQFAAKTGDPEVAARWAAGVVRWGDGFVAFGRLGLPDLYTDEVFATFEGLYGGSCASVQEAAVQQVEALGWTHALEEFRRSEAIAEDLLDFDYDAVIERLHDIYSFVKVGDRVHLFYK